MGWGGKDKETGMLRLEIMRDLISLAQNYTTFDLYTNMYVYMVPYLSSNFTLSLWVN